jgi:hypothetical protein
VSLKNGKELRIFIPPEDQGIPEALKFLAPARFAASSTNSKIVIETINGKSASRSEYVDALKSMGFLPDRSKLILW